MLQRCWTLAFKVVTWSTQVCIWCRSSHMFPCIYTLLPIMELILDQFWLHERHVSWTEWLLHHWVTSLLHFLSYLFLFELLPLSWVQVNTTKDSVPSTICSRCMYFDCCRGRVPAFANLSANQESSGDSYTTTGFDPTTGPQPSLTNPLGNPAYYGDTSSNGPNWVDYITTTYNKSLILTYNLAYSGATVDSSLVAQDASTVLDLKQQIEDEYLPLYGNQSSAEELGADWNASNSLFGIFIGINDVGNSYTEQNTSLNGDIFQVYSTLVQEVCSLLGFHTIPAVPSPGRCVLVLFFLRFTNPFPWSSSFPVPFFPSSPILSVHPSSYPTISHLYNPLTSCHQLYQSGARNFLILNVPPVNRAPLTTALGSSDIQLEASDITDFNNRIQTLASNLTDEYSDTTVFVYDTRTLFNQVLDDPQQFNETAGYKNTTGYCVAYEE